jgi:hypothetical protein
MTWFRLALTDYQVLTLLEMGRSQHGCLEAVIPSVRRLHPHTS